MQGVLRTRKFGFLKTASLKERTVTIDGGPGCSPDMGLKRTLSVHYVIDNFREEIDSYDLEYVIDSAGKKINRLVEPETDVEPVKLTTEVKPVTVKRKR